MSTKSQRGTWKITIVIIVHTSARFINLKGPMRVWILKNSVPTYRNTRPVYVTKISRW